MKLVSLGPTEADQQITVIFLAVFLMYIICVVSMGLDKAVHLGQMSLYIYALKFSEVNLPCKPLLPWL